MNAKFFRNILRFFIGRYADKILLAENKKLKEQNDELFKVLEFAYHQIKKIQQSDKKQVKIIKEIIALTEDLENGYVKPELVPNKIEDPNYYYDKNALIKILRSSNIKQKTLAKLLGVDETIISHVLAGRRSSVLSPIKLSLKHQI